MKKLFLILSAAGLTATTSSLVVSCSSDIDRWNKVEFSDSSVYNELILKMLDSDLITKSQANNFFDISDTDQVADVVKVINKAITDLEYNFSSEYMESLFKIDNQSSEPATNQILDNLATTIVYNDYTSKMITNNGKSIGDSTFGKRALNPNNLMDNDEDYNYAIYFIENNSENSAGNPVNQYLRWQHSFEFDNKLKKTQTPSLELLSDNDETRNQNFIIVGTKDTDPLSTNQILSLPEFAIGSDKLNESNPQAFKIDEQFTGFEIMKYRFQNYISSEIKPTLYDQLLGMAYLNDSIFSTNSSSYNYTNNSARLNTTNKLVTSFQNKLNESQESNIKMVWSIQLENGTSQEIENWVNSLKTSVNNTTENGNIRISGDALTKIIKPLLNGNNFQNDTKAGYDNFFGIKGYNGIVRDTDSGIEALTSQTLNISSEAQTAANAINSPTILTNNGLGYSLNEGDATELVLVLPLYLNDLYSYHNINIVENQITIPENTWITLSDKLFNYDKITSVSQGANTTVATDNDGNFYLKLNSSGAGNVLINGSSISINSEDDLSTLGVSGKINKSDTNFTSSFDQENQAKFADDDQIIYQVNFTRTTDPSRNYSQMVSWEAGTQQSLDVRNLQASQKQALLDQIINGLVAKDTSYVDEAKTVLYTKYITTSDIILSQALYDQISKYIKEDDDETSD